ncbi:MAG: hypothetical protein U0790_22000 [Isosphaeraceae bacterium]
MASSLVPPGRTPPARHAGSRPRARRVGASLLVVAAMVGATLVMADRARRRWFADPDEVLKRGQAALAAERIDEAEAAVTALRSLRRPLPEDAMLRGRVHLARGRIDQAVADLALVPDEHESAARARLMAGQAELRRHRAREAEALLRRAIRLDPALIPARRELIYILGYQLRRAEVSSEFEALSRCTELSPENVFHWSLLRKVTWRPETAIAELTRFLEADPGDRWSRLALADNFRRSGLVEDAESLLAPLPGSDPDALAIRVEIALDRHRADEAERLLDSSDSRAPRLARLRGRMALARRDAAAALRWFRLAEADPVENRDVLFGLVNALDLLGDAPAAAAARVRARDLDRLNTLIERAAVRGARTDPALLRALGSACATLGYDSEARAWFRLAIARNPLDTEAQQALFRLGTLPARMPRSPLK